jgi:pyruvate dehydrogenase E2 component (dihydrolipoamide acetyltransferase)
MADITMPQLGETVTEGTITKWFKQVGDEVAEDEVLFEVSTDKVDSEVPSPTAGYVTEILVAEGDTVPVGSKLAVISADAPADGGGGDAAPAPAEEEKAEKAEKAETAAEPEAEPEPAADEPAADEAPEAEAEPEPEQVEPEREAAASEAPAKAEEPAPAPKSEAPAAEHSGNGGGPVLSPVVRKLIADNSLDASQITGTGAGGRITREDVLSHLDTRKSSAPAAKEAPAAKAPAASAAAPTAAGPEAKATAASPAPAKGDEVIPFTNIRRRTAEHMVRSKATSAHTLCAIEVDYEAVDRVRRAHKDEFKAREGVSLTYLPFVSRAVIDAIRDYPNVNASVGEDALVVHHAIHLGIAVDLDLAGLIVPVIHQADGLRLPAIARTIADLANRARSKKLGADEIAGGTFTITNPGPFGSFLTAPIINQPQVAILSTDGIKKRPVVVELPDGSDGIVIHPTGNLALSFDHRVVDGAYAAAFLKRIKDTLETRDWEAEL